MSDDAELRGEIDALKADNDQLRADLRKVATSHANTQAAVAALDDRVRALEQPVPPAAEVGG